MSSNKIVNSTNDLPIVGEKLADHLLDLISGGFGDRDEIGGEEGSYSKWSWSKIFG
jgi:hypothetical protein